MRREGGGVRREGGGVRRDYSIRCQLTLSLKCRPSSAMWSIERGEDFADLT